MINTTGTSPNGQPLLSVMSDPLHDQWIEDMVVVPSMGIIFTHCSMSIKYWPLQDIRHNMKNLKNKSMHLFKEDGCTVPKVCLRDVLKKKGDDDPAGSNINKITKLEFYEPRNLLIVAFRDTSLLFIKVLLGTRRTSKFRRRHQLIFKTIKIMRTAEELGYANIKLCGKLLLLGELVESFKVLDMRNGKQILAPAKDTHMEDWVQGMAAGMNNRYLAFSTIYGTLAIYKTDDPTALDLTNAYQRVFYDLKFMEYKNGKGGIHCIASTNERTDKLLFIGGRREDRFAHVTIVVFNLETMSKIFELGDSLSYGLFTSIWVMRVGQSYTLITKNQDHAPGQPTLLRIDFNTEEENTTKVEMALDFTPVKVEKSKIEFKDVKYERFPTNGTGQKEGSLFAERVVPINPEEPPYIEVINCARSKTIHYLKLNDQRAPQLQASS